MYPRLLRLLLLAALLAAGCVESTAKDRNSDQNNGTSTPGEVTIPGPTATPTISLTPPVSATPAGLSAARMLEAEGELQQALEAYLTIAVARSPEWSEGAYGAARVLLQMERPSEARTLLEPFISAAGPAEAAPARYMLARAYTALAMYNEALQQYDLYIHSGRAAVPYAYLDRARILMDFGQPLMAAAEAQIGLNARLPGAARSTFILITAQSFEKGGAFVEALRWYQALHDASPGDQPLALQRMAAIKQAQGNPDYVNDLFRIMGGFPSTQLALDTVKDFEAKGQPIDGYLCGLVYYRHNDYDRAEAALREKVQAAPESADSAEAYYYLGAILESRGDTAQAQTYYTKVTTLNPAGGLADDALWWRARLLEDDGNAAEAQSLYNSIVSTYPGSNWAADAAFRRGLLSYRSSRYDEAASIWGEGTAAVTDASQRQRLTLWQGKALLKAGEKTTADPLLRQLAAAGEDDYYGVRAALLLKGEHNQPKAERDSKADLRPKLDWPAAESWLASKAGRAVVPGSAQAWSSDLRWQHAQELWLVGRVGQANTEMFDLIEANARDPIAMYSMARTLWDEGQFSLSARAGQRLLRVLDTNPNTGLPRELLSLSYPAPFGANLQRYADAEKISPLLMLAFIRQESFFDPAAESPANAYGLTQVLPSTANSVAQKLGMGPVDVSRLFQADLNIRLGASYMASQLKEFDNNIFVAFAAYNAGPDAARRWLKSAGNDADLYLETVEFRETRLYVEIVAENYAIYRYIYGGRAVPDLPGD